MLHEMSEANIFGFEVALLEGGVAGTLPTWVEFDLEFPFLGVSWVAVNDTRDREAILNRLFEVF